MQCCNHRDPCGLDRMAKLGKAGLGKVRLQRQAAGKVTPLAVRTIFEMCSGRSSQAAINAARKDGVRLFEGGVAMVRTRTSSLSLTVKASATMPPASSADCNVK